MNFGAASLCAKCGQVPISHIGTSAEVLRFVREIYWNRLQNQTHHMK